MSDFHLVQSCTPHSSDIRAVLVISENLLVTGSRDGSVMVHERDSSSGKYRHVATGTGHSNFVSGLCLLQSPDEVALVLSASNDKTVALWSVPTGSYDGDLVELVPQALANGHTDVVSAVAAVSAMANAFVTASWDHSLRLWSLDTVQRGGDEEISIDCRAVLQGHSHSVWCVLELDDGSIVSGSADTTLRRWNVAESGHAASGVATLGACIYEHKAAHKAPVRALARVPLLGFVSTGNDGIVHLWTSMATGEFSVLRSFEAAPTTGTGYVYGLALLAKSMEAVSCGEESWVAFHSLDSGDPSAQSVAVPGSAWCCATTPETGDVVVGCSDGGYRVFSRNEAIVASAEETSEYEAAIAKSITERTKASGGMDVSKVKPAEVVLAAPATRDGETRMARQGDKAYAFTWRAGEGTWEMIGEVEGPADDTAHGGVERNGMLNGVRFDYLFDVDLDGRKMRLGHNSGENPYMSAQKFIHDNDLGQDYLQEIAEWVSAQLGESAAPMDVSVNADPYTGGGSYSVPSSGSGSSSSASTAPRSTGPPPMINPDPFTGGGAYNPGTPSASAALQPSLSNILPQREYVLFQSLKQVDTMETRLLEAVADDTAAATTVQGLVSMLRGKATLTWPAETVTLLTTLVERRVVPAFDLLRLLAVNEDAARALAKPESAALLKAVFSLIDDESAATPLTVLTLRFTANCCAHATLRSSLLSALPAILRSTRRASSRPHPKPVSLAAATLHLNIGTLLAAAGHVVDSSLVSTYLRTLGTALPPENEEAAQFSLLVGLGTVLTAGGEDRIAEAKEAGCVGAVAALAASGSDKVREAAKAVLAVVG